MVTDHDHSKHELRGVQIAVLTKTPTPGLVKTRLIPALGAAGAARLQRQLTRSALACAQQAQLGPVTLWCAPDTGHHFFRALHTTTAVNCQTQPVGDLGARMLAAFEWHCRQGPLLLIGSDCPALMPWHLRAAAAALVDGDDAVYIPAEDGGYVLVGMSRPQPALFTGMAWSTAEVMSETRARANAQGLRLRELVTLWDVDVPSDLPRLRALQRQIKTENQSVVSKRFSEENELLRLGTRV
jgi:uncharacterized protein